MSDVEFHPYSSDDKADCLALLEGNTPKYFAPSERQDFIGFLDDDLSTLNGAYLVMSRDGQTIGCGGYDIDAATGTAKLCWGMVSQSHHKTGLGRKLLEARLKGIDSHGGTQRIVIDTSQLSAPFFEHFGFKVTATKKDGYGPGIDHVEMIRQLG